MPASSAVRMPRLRVNTGAALELAMQLEPPDQAPLRAVLHSNRWVYA